MTTAKLCKIACSTEEKATYWLTKCLWPVATCVSWNTQIMCSMSWRSRSSAKHIQWTRNVRIWLFKLRIKKRIHQYFQFPVWNKTLSAVLFRPFTSEQSWLHINLPFFPLLLTRLVFDTEMHHQLEWQLWPPKMLLNDQGWGILAHFQVWWDMFVKNKKKFVLQLTSEKKNGIFTLFWKENQCFITRPSN